MEYTNRLSLDEFARKITLFRHHIAQHIVGQEQAVTYLLTALLADGHVLIEGMPGIAKTLLAKTIAHLLDVRFSRLQFTPDLMPSDALGTNVYNLQTQSFELHRGPVFTQLLLVDEINRAPAKTQSALFEVMEEKQATIDGVRHAMDDFYFIIATQNPIEQEGTYRLPEAQMDRFLLKIDMGYPTANEELQILQHYNVGKDLRVFQETVTLLTATQVLDMRSYLPKVVADDLILNYICRLVQSTREHSLIQLGASPRATIALLKCAKAHALLEGRDFVIPDDVKQIAPAVLRHRISLTAEAEMNGWNPTQLIGDLLKDTQTPQ